TVALCARLLRLRHEWDLWRENFHKLPDARHFISKRPIDQPFVLKDGKAIRLIFVSRHDLDLPDVTDQGRIMERFYAGAPSQTFNSLLSSLATRTEVLRRDAGRRLFLLISPRGVGKGHFFAALQQRAPGGRLSQFLAAVCPKSVTEYVVGFFN